jgi:type VI secretion system protein
MFFSYRPKPATATATAAAATARAPLPPRRAALLALGLMVAGGPLLAGCGSIGAGARALVGAGPRAVKPDWERLDISAAADANGNSALAVDVVLVRDKAMLDSLALMSASKYFAARADLERTFPDALTVLAVEITPGQRITLDPKAYGGQRVWAALAFAGYASEGEHRTRLLLNNGGYVLQLNAQDFVASALE